MIIPPLMTSQWLMLTLLVRHPPQVSLLHRKEVMNQAGQATLLGLHELLTYGLKGVAAYAHHAEMLGMVDEKVDDDLQRCLAFLASPESSKPEAVLAQAMALGEVNFRVMALLDKGHTSRWAGSTHHVMLAWLHAADSCSPLPLPADYQPVLGPLVLACYGAPQVSDTPPAAAPALQVRQPRAHPGAHHPGQGQGHPHQWPRHARPGGPAEADGGQG
jgi:hypothetical protein